MTVYADILFLVNMSLNWFSLILTSRIMKYKSPAPRMLAAAALGALAGVCAVIFPGTLSVALIEIASSFLMCAVAFKSSSLIVYIKLCCALFASGITLGGSLTLLYSFFNRSGITFQNQSDLSTAVFILLSFGVTVTALIFERVLASGKSRHSGKLTVEIDNKKTTVPCFCDSGNFLREPISGRPAIIIGAPLLKGLLCEDTLTSPEPFSDIDFSVDRRRVRLIPASSVCGKGIMLGILPDRIILNDGSVRELDAIIAVDKSDDGAHRDFAIVPASIT